MKAINFLIAMLITIVINTPLFSQTQYTEKINPINLYSDTNTSKQQLKYIVPAPGQMNSVAISFEGIRILDFLYWKHFAASMKSSYYERPFACFPRNDSTDLWKQEKMKPYWYEDRIVFAWFPSGEEIRDFDADTRYEQCFKIAKNNYIPDWGVRKKEIDSSSADINWWGRSGNYNIKPIYMDKTKFKEADADDLKDYKQKNAPGNTNSIEEENDEKIDQ